MKTSRVKELKQSLWNCANLGEEISQDEAQDLLDLMNRVFQPKAKVIKDPSPMIGNNPFRKVFTESDVVSDGDHLRVDSPADVRSKFYGLLNEATENGND